MAFRQESDEIEVWYSETDDPEEELKMFTVSKWLTLRELMWWLTNIRDLHENTKIHFLREHFQ